MDTSPDNARQKTLILMPAFNEADHIRPQLQGIRDCAPDSDILVVNDGSSDTTAFIAREEGAAVVTHPFQMGYGAAVQTGYKYALEQGYQFLIQLDADGQHHPESIQDLLSPLHAGECDFSLGSRFHPESGYRMQPARLFGVKVFRWVVRLATRLKIKDPTSGFVAMNHEVMEYFASDIFPTDYPDADMIILLNRVGFVIQEIPVKMQEHDGPSMHDSTWKNFYYAFKVLLAIAVLLLRSKKHTNPTYQRKMMSP